AISCSMLRSDRSSFAKIAGEAGLALVIEMIGRTELNSEQKNYLSVLKHSTDNLKEIINQVLDFSKIEAGKVSLRQKAFEFEVLINNAHSLFANLCNKDIVFESYIDPEIPEYIKADQNRIIQVINNLVSNAIKFTEKGDITINANLVERKSNNQIIIKIEISDTGIGIKPEKQKHLFIPFSQIEEQDTRDYDGTGLGLSICKELVQLHGGEIGLNSEYGVGSTFWFTFIAKEVSCESAKKKIKEPKATKKTKNLKILFAEDKLTNQKVVKLMLNHLGHEVEMATNGREAVEKFKQGKFDLVIMDIQMPVMDGITATNLLKEKYDKLPPIVGLSANAFEGDREKYMKLGMDEYMTKPFTIDDFNALFDRLFNK
ncbi:MAG: ATP-binding protein, partial [Bacteroidales bacterium]